MSILLVVRHAEEGPGLLAWGLRAASALELPLEVVCCDAGAGEELTWRQEGDEPPVFLHDSKVRWGRVRVENALAAVTDHVMSAGVKYVFTGKRNSGQEAKGSPERRLSQALFEQIPCAILVMRLPEGGESQEGRILVPAAGGPHSRTALELAHKLVGPETTAFFVEPYSDEVSREVGERQLHKAVRGAGIDPAEIGCEVALGEQVSDEIRRQAESGHYGLVLIGASDSRTLRSKLFGTVPDRLLRGPAGMGIGVVRSALPAPQRWRGRVGRLLRLSVPQLDREERIALVDEIEGKARWTFDFALLMALATLIAALGLLANSVAVVIGAMLVAPLMTPLIGGGLAMVQGNWPLWLRSSRAVLLGFFLALVIGLAVGLLARLLGFGLTSELAARGEPTLLDLGVAFASGIAASYCLARPHLTGALAGVAIAAALVPPIATVGLCLALGETVTAQGAALLFGTNVVAIVLGAAVHFFAAGIRGRREGSGLWPRRFIIVLALACAGLAVPLTSILLGKVTTPRALERSLAEVAEQSDYRLLKLRRSRSAGAPLVEIELAGREPPSESLVDALKARAEERMDRAIRLRVRTILETRRAQ
ncbi:MAG: hypothetical protein CMP28_09250 [Roseibacillus sp.]|nr:hypothetical protein [Roseibacillus sp.]